MVSPECRFGHAGWLGLYTRKHGGLSLGAVFSLNFYLILRFGDRRREVKDPVVNALARERRL
jgi:hypothetical protein